MSICKKCGEKLIVPTWVYCQSCTDKKRDALIKKAQKELISYNFLKKEEVCIYPKYEYGYVEGVKYKDATLIVVDGDKIVGYSNYL